MTTKTKKAEKFTPLKDLSCDAIYEKSVEADWTKGYGETWQYVESQRCDKCGEAVQVSGAGDMHSTIDSTVECDGYVGDCEGPMMNYYYPLPDTVDQVNASDLLVDLPLCLICFDENDRQALALTGGGMNLAWEICEGYMRLGFLPPIHFADLPAMAGRGQSKRDRWVLAGCRCSFQVAILQAKNGLRSLRAIGQKGGK